VARRHYSKRHFERLSNGGPDTPDRVSERVHYREAAAQAHKEMLDRFSPLTTDNVQEAFTWQAKRLTELTEQSG